MSPRPRKPRLAIRIVASRGIPGMLSVRTENDPEALSARSFRQALADAGFQEGDEAELVLLHRPVKQ